MVVARYHGPWAEIDVGGQVKLFEAPAWCSYGVGWSPSGDVVYSGSLAEYVLVRNGKPPVKVELAREQRLPGWPEYFCGFGIEADGSGYGVTLDNRVARIGRDGQLVEIKPFF
jgi:sugar lactone lactonase YvrE